LVKIHLSVQLVLLMMNAPFAFPLKRIWNDDSGIGSLRARPNGWEIELSKIITCHLICHFFSSMQNILATKTIKRMRKRTLWWKKGHWRYVHWWDFLRTHDFNYYCETTWI